ncbi:MAG: hypothetical protein IM631_12630 [Cytophagales bacterium]|jgi:hypothetical protein|nr:hypothetical protein [Cytophagales bacterium]MCA6382361.1 hypothetical protein [Cytophagales bacterium]
MKTTFLKDYQILKESVFVAILSSFNSKIDKEAPFPSVIFTENKFVPEKAGENEFLIGLTLDKSEDRVMVVTCDDDGEHEYPFSVESDQLTLLDLCTIHQVIA